MKERSPDHATRKILKESLVTCFVLAALFYVIAYPMWLGGRAIASKIDEITAVLNRNLHRHEPED